MGETDAMLVEMPEIDRFAGWLSCPDCERGLDPVAPDALICSSGHRFATNRRGYVGLIPAGWRIPGAPSGRPSTSSAPSALASTVAATLPRHGLVLELSPRTSDVLAAVGSGSTSLAAAALSASPRDLEAIVTATGAAAVLADPSRRWPVRDGAVAALIAVDAPLVPLEFHRVLAPGGALVLAPTEAGAEGMIDDLFPWFEHDQSRPVPGAARTALRLRRRRRMLTW